MFGNLDNSYIKWMQINKIIWVQRKSFEGYIWETDNIQLQNIIE